MTEFAERARENFLGGMTCSEAVVSAFAGLLPIDAERLRALARPFGGGMGRLRLTCGAVSGAVMTLGLCFPEAEKSALYGLVQEFASRFEGRNGSVICGELLAGKGIGADRSPAASPRTEGYYRKRPCPDLVYDAAEILGELLKEHRKC